MSDRKKPETKKSRMIAELSGALVDLVLNDYYDPTKSTIVDEVVKSNLSESSPRVMFDMMSAEISNNLESYFAEVCQAASDELGYPFHYTSKLYYKKDATLAKSHEEMRKLIVVFGNGRTGKAAGVRFVTPDDEPDPLYLIHLNKELNVVNAAINTRNDKFQKALSSGVVSLETANSIRLKLPKMPAEPLRLAATESEE